MFFEKDVDFFELDERTIEDLKIERVLNAIFGRKGEGRDLFKKIPRDPEALKMRLEISRALMNVDLRRAIGRFVEDYKAFLRLKKLAEDLDHEVFKLGWTLESSLKYCQIVKDLVKALDSFKTRSRVLEDFLEFLKSHAGSSGFIEMCDKSRELKEYLSDLEFKMEMRPGRITVRRRGDGSNLSEEVERIFKMFQPKVEDKTETMNMSFGRLEALVIYRALELEKGVLNALRLLWNLSESVFSERISEFYECVEFFIRIFDFYEKLGLPYTVPELGGEDIRIEGFYDPWLATKIGEKTVKNDLCSFLDERVFVITGPNSGGKTTFLRALGYVFLMANLGLPVPAERAKIPKLNGLFTAFDEGDRAEEGLSGLEKALRRVKEVLDSSDEGTIILVNEILSGTSPSDAEILGRRIVSMMLEKGIRVFWVTFVYSLAESDGCVSLVAGVENGERTYKISRKKIEGRALALSLARFFGLTEEGILKEVRRR